MLFVLVDNVGFFLRGHPSIDLNLIVEEVVWVFFHKLVIDGISFIVDRVVAKPIHFLCLVLDGSIDESEFYQQGPCSISVVVVPLDDCQLLALRNNPRLIGYSGCRVDVVSCYYLWRNLSFRKASDDVLCFFSHFVLQSDQPDHLNT